MVPDPHGDRPASGSIPAPTLADLAARVAALEAQIELLHAASLPAPAHSTQQIAPTPLASAPVATPASLPPPLAPRASLENRIGSQVFNRVGILALLIGVAWALKLAGDNHLLGPLGRVVVGLLAGAGLVLWSERFRRSGFAAFSYSLKAIGTGVLYLSLWAAFQIYGLLSAPVALSAMVLVTAWNAWMAWAQDAELLAAYALIGALLTPLLLSTGGNHQVFLFTYLAAMDLATLLLVRLKPWPRLFLAAFPSTVSYYVAWYFQFGQHSPTGLTLLFLAIFFAIFAAPVLLLTEPQQAAQRVSPGASSLTYLYLPIANAVFTGLAVYLLLEDIHRSDLTSWAMLLLSAIYLGLLRLRQPHITAAVHLSLAITFLTIAIPLKASGDWITISWLVEGAALLWVAIRLSAPPAHSLPVDHLPAASVPYHPAGPLRALASVALLLGFCGVLWNILVSPRAGPAFLNQHFLTALLAIATFALSTWLASRARSAASALPSWHQIAALSLVALNLVAVLASVREIAALWPLSFRNPDDKLQRSLAISAFLMLYGAALLAVGFWRRASFIRWQALALLVFSIAKTFLYDIRDLSQGYRVVSFLGLGALLMAVSFAYQKDWLALRDQVPSAEAKP